MAADMFEAKHFSNLTHWQSLAWHGAPRDHWRETVPSVDDCSRTAPPPPTQGWLECLGIGGWLPSESPAGLRRNDRLESVGIRRRIRMRFIGRPPGQCRPAPGPRPDQGPDRLPFHPEQPEAHPPAKMSASTDSPDLNAVARAAR
jgi:hypothetical protein